MEHEEFVVAQAISGLLLQSFLSISILVLSDSPCKHQGGFEHSNRLALRVLLYRAPENSLAALFLLCGHVDQVSGDPKS